MSRIYVYGVVRTGHPLPTGPTGVGSPPEPLRALPAGALTAVISAAPDGMLARRRDIIAHQDALLALAATGPVIPMRFGSLAPDEDTVRARLSDRPEEQLAVLERLAGRVEMNLKALVVEDALPQLLCEDGRLRRLHSQLRAHPGYEASIRLGQAVAEGLQRRALRAAVRTRDRIRALADDTAAGPELDGCVLNLSFLLRREAEEEFRATVADCVAEYTGHADFRLSGPLPCFSFTALPGQAAPARRSAPTTARAR
ncbi:GvpL/GvpF family gas vesicle protein [Streptomyces carpaticus]|uniref:GvpL/GvpF family gas vesicle protein n=1 Tax=Streptomyces carpaticus TaxID=285558 RepID=UPI002204A0B6|nr:GvpL/GvpF family gas vesicle protein [Streptomyces carpaticus]